MCSQFAHFRRIRAVYLSLSGMLLTTAMFILFNLQAHVLKWCEVWSLNNQFLSPLSLVPTTSKLHMCGKQSYLYISCIFFKSASSFVRKKMQEIITKHLVFSLKVCALEALRACTLQSKRCAILCRIQSSSMLGTISKEHWCTHFSSGTSHWNSWGDLILTPQ